MPCLLRETWSGLQRQGETKSGALFDGPGRTGSAGIAERDRRDGRARPHELALARREQSAVVAHKIGRITPAGMITEFPLPSGTFPYKITAGKDGNLWFTMHDRIGRLTPAGVFTAFPLPTPNTFPGGITATSDGNIWFVEVLGRKIGRLVP